MKLSYLPLYVQTREEGGRWTTESGPRPAAEVVVPYAALVMQVELLAGSEPRHGATSQLERRGWSLAIDPMEEIRHMKCCGREILLELERNGKEDAGGEISPSNSQGQPSEESPEPVTEGPQVSPAIGVVRSRARPCLA